MYTMMNQTKTPEYETPDWSFDARDLPQPKHATTYTTPAYQGSAKQRVQYTLPPAGTSSYGLKAQPYQATQGGTPNNIQTPPTVAQPFTRSVSDIHLM